jgi:hypothetical protein
MNHHLGILQEGIQTVAIGWERTSEEGERRGCEVYHCEEENLDA